MLIHQFCEATGLSRDTVRFYVKRGLLTPSIGAGQSTNRYQVFDLSQVERARLIRAAQGLGFTLTEIAALAKAYEDGALTRARRAEVLREHLAALDERAARLRAVRSYLSAKLRWVESGERGAPPATPPALRQPDATRATHLRGSSGGAAPNTAPASAASAGSTPLRPSRRVRATSAAPRRAR